jgi:DMSO/TMAO reductase YedYZ molybdopterin-dependent catalytic subunit
MTTTRTAPPTPPAPRVSRAGRPRWWVGALAGALAAGVAMAAGELVAGLVESVDTPVVSVGEVVIEHAPSWLKDFAIRTFGEDDKPALIAGTAATLALVSIMLGVLSVRRLWVGVAGTVALGAVGAWSALTRPGADARAFLPSVVAALTGVAALILLLRWAATADRRSTSPAPARARPGPPAAEPAAVATTTVGPGATPEPPTATTGRDPVGIEAPPKRHGDASATAGPRAPDDGPGERPPVRVPTRAPAPAGFDRRRFLVSALAVGGGAIVAVGAGRRLQGRFSVGSDRAALALPAPASPAAALPAGVDLGVPGLSPFVTANADFYRVDTALVVPQVAPDSWELTIGGMVDRPLTFSFEDLLDRRLVERDITLVCVSNEVGGGYAGTARWLGVPLADLLEEAGVRPGADQLVSRSVDGWTAGTPTAAVMDGRDALVAIGMNGEPLPLEHGFPARMVTPGLYGYTSATKWLTELELTTFDAYDAYWLQRGWAQVAPIKTMTRIDTPAGLARMPAGPVPIGGVAWAVHRGVDAVEVRIDEGPWQPARLGAVPSVDTWRQWVFEWDATPGRHTIEARAVDGTGEVQTDRRAEPIPDGASGWHSVVVLVD